MKNCKMLLFSLLFLMTLGTGTVAAITLKGDYIGKITSVKYNIPSYFDTSWIRVGDPFSFSYTFEKNMDDLADSPFSFTLEVNNSIYWDESLENDSPYMIDADLYSNGMLRRVVIDEIGDHRPVPPLIPPHVWTWEPDDAYATFTFSDTGELTGCEYIVGWIDDSSGGPKGTVRFTYDSKPTPEPSSVILVISGLVGFAGLRKTIRV